VAVDVVDMVEVVQVATGASVVEVEAELVVQAVLVLVEVLH
jgi:hypothetical protein